MDYDFTAETSLSAPIDEAKIDPTKLMTPGTETTNVSEIEFSEDKKLILIWELKPKTTLS